MCGVTGVGEEVGCRPALPDACHGPGETSLDAGPSFMALNLPFKAFFLGEFQGGGS